jgi:hypothetical protein
LMSNSTFCRTTVANSHLGTSQQSFSGLTKYRDTQSQWNLINIKAAIEESA